MCFKIRPHVHMPKHEYAMVQRCCWWLYRACTNLHIARRVEPKFKPSQYKVKHRNVYVSTKNAGLCQTRQPRSSLLCCSPVLARRSATRRALAKASKCDDSSDTHRNTTSKNLKHSNLANMKALNFLYYVT